MKPSLIGSDQETVHERVGEAGLWLCIARAQFTQGGIDKLNAVGKSMLKHTVLHPYTYEYVGSMLTEPVNEPFGREIPRSESDETLGNDPPVLDAMLCRF